MAVTIDANDDNCYVVIFCDQVMKLSSQGSKKLDFNMNNFKIGENHNGQIREFKFYKMAIGA